MNHKTSRVPPDLADEITRRARVKGVPDADYYRSLIERGLWIESAELPMDNPVPPRYWALYEALLETRNILRASPPRATTARSRRSNPGARRARTDQKR